LLCKYARASAEKFPGGPNDKTKQQHQDFPLSIGELGGALDTYPEPQLNGALCESDYLFGETPISEKMHA